MHDPEQKLKKDTPKSFEKLDQITDASGVYASWLKNDLECIYIGKAKLPNRIRSHFSGQRGGDQFCLYIYDYYLHEVRPDGMLTPQVNKLTQDWIRENVLFTIVEMNKSDINEFETYLRRKWKPTLNSL